MTGKPRRARGRGEPARTSGAEDGSAAGEPAARLSIGALSRATGIPVETLRTWELRYGYPVPARKPSGHRVYPVSCVSRLRRIAEALARGHRAGDVVPASDAGVIALLEGTTDTPIVSRAAPAPDLETHDLLRAVQAFDGDRLMRTLFADSARLGPLDFLRTRIVPLIHAVGEAWATKRMDIQHERFVSERISDLLRTLRLPLEGRAMGGHRPGHTARGVA